MLKNIQKIVISKTFLISLILICLMFTSFGVAMEDTYAYNLNESSEIGMEVDLEDKLENSQENVIGLVNTQESELLQDTNSLNGGTFTDIKNAIRSANSGDTIRLSGIFVSTKENDTISLSKKLNIVSSSGATLDGKNQGLIFKITAGAAGSTIENIKFVNGSSGGKGGAVVVASKYITFDGCVFENNHAEVTSGAIATPLSAETSLGLTIKNCNFTKNHAKVAAGAVGAYSHDFKIFNCIFDSNYVNGSGEAYGGAIQVGLDTETSYGTVMDCLFVNNKAISTGAFSHAGAGCVRNGSSYTNCVFINNSADRGGALTYHASGNLNNCTLINNTANEFGGGISIMLNYLDYMDLNITNSIFKGNKAPLGGAAKFDGFNIKIEDSIFEDNYATVYGGAINIEANVVRVINSEFNNNIANFDGGALYIKGNNTYVANSLFVSNDAIPDVNKLNDGLGGAIYVNSSKVLVENNVFEFNTARNGSAIYFDENGVEFKLNNNTLYQNQAWVYHLPIFAQDIFYGDVENIKSIIFGGNNIADYDNLAVSNAIYNAADYDKIEIEGESPVSGATMSGELYQDDREYNMRILMAVEHEDGTVVYNNTLNSNYLGEVSDNLTGLKPGRYYVTAKHFEDNYYKAITNMTVFNVIPKVDNRIVKSSSKNSINYGDYALWTLNITNNGPNDATGVVVYDVLPDGLIWKSDDSNDKYDRNTGVLDIGDLRKGETFVLNIITQVNKTGAIVNKANVTGIEFDTDLNNNHDEKSITVPNAADLSIVKSVNVTNPNYNELVVWSLTVRNNGPDVAHDVEVFDLLPKSLIFDSCDSTNYNNDTGIWYIGTLGVNNLARLNIVARVNSTGAIENNATVTLREYDYDLSNNYDDAQINVPQAVDVSVLKSVNVTNPNYNGLVEWTLTAKNNGPDIAHDVKVVDMIPSSLKLVSCDSNNYNNVTGVWNIGTLNVNKSVKLNLVCRVIATGRIANNANVTSYEFDYDLSNNKDQRTISVAPASDLKVQKIVNKSNPNYSDSIRWTVKVTNNGPDVAHNVEIVDLLPKSLIFGSATGNYNKNTGTWQIDALNPSSSVEFSIICKVNTTGKVINHVNVTADEFDYDLTNNFDNETIMVPLASDLEIIKLVNTSIANYTDLINWTLIIKNNGPNNATGVKVFDVLPEGFVYLNSSLGKDSYSKNCFYIGNLNVNEILKINITTLMNRTGNFINRANITGNEYDYNLKNNDANKSIFIEPAADLEVTKLVNDSNPNFRDLVKWTIIVKNNGQDVAHNVKLTDVIPKSLIWDSDDSQGKYDHNVGILNIGTLNKKDSIELNVITRVNATGNITNIAYVTADEFDYNLVNNEDNKTIFVNKSGDLFIEKTVNNSNVNYGDYVKWILVASNNGPDKVTGVVVNDVLPRGLILSNYTASKGFYDEGVWNICCLEKGEIQTLELICLVNITGNITNIAKISGIEYDPDLTNNMDNASIKVPEAADILVLKQVNNHNPFFGDVINWTIMVTNLGPDRATNVRVFDQLVDELLFIGYTSTRGRYSDGIWSLDYLNNGETEYLNISCYVNGLGKIINNVSAIADEYDFNMSNNHDFELINSSPVTDLSIEKFANVSNANYNDLIKWTIIVSNEGFNDATGVIVEDVLPNGLEFVNATGYGHYEDDIWNIGGLEVGDYKKLEIITKVIATGDITNYAVVYGNEEDPNPLNNEAEYAVYVNPACDLSITKTVSKYIFKEGDIVSYSIRLSNNGPDNALNVLVSEEFDKSLVLKSYKTTKGTFDTSTKEWSMDELAAGGEEKLLLNFEAIKDGIVKNVVSVLSDTFDIDLSNNDDFTLVKIIKSPNNYSMPFIKKSVEVKAQNAKYPASNLEKNPTANLILLLIASTLISIIFGSSDIFKKR